MSEPDSVLAHQFWLYGKDRKKLERLSNKIVDLIFKKFGSDIGVLTSTFANADDVEENAAERALKRLSGPVPKPWGKNQTHTHAYNSAIRHAERVIREELTKYHGL
ncbi:hypothetical protein [Mycobacteroides immunogenum]|uniref:Uncharacterized protein n=1 Tax=Mycobacteroides immunogenum TaxID=83262 RepID=A0A7V8LQY1_9MYCO|nr:hypothetical protein [Mycobacteroides immunogenum]KPG13728.1 hypothetical protein AN909_05570 [Mycobacteroides immunogenum]KPG14283.1 hypothetical protein AN908_06835 [Mycobacteroides immunogenum]KPG14355.1 hypothetical protein AN908_07320 [Mycobacteroides immunogenum]KPG17442.1 hypothetical protein AN910_04795 [Mycobacteroides immunogenum]KPG23974.1 hypothetical protein AN911_00365 [Mycobacteroides immunogenum]